jgi:AraC family transcriptional regulator of arabinose operon
LRLTAHSEIFLRVIQNYDGVKISWANRSIQTPRSAIGQIVYEPGGYCGPRLQRDYELVIIHSGACEVSINGISRDLQLASVHLFLPRHQEYYRFSDRTQTHHSWCTIAPRAMPRSLARELGKAPVSVPMTEVFRHLLDAASALRLPKSPVAGQQIDHLALCLFTEYVRLAEETAGDPGWNSPARKAERWMEDHYGEEHCLQAAIAASGLSKNALAYKFRQQFNDTPGHYLWKLRAERGVALLLSSGHTVSQIAYNCGFQNPFHFSRLIKRFYGASPLLLRKKLWAANSRPNPSRR